MRNVAAIWGVGSPKRRWRIENEIHWVRDVVYDEDLSQIRTGRGAQSMAGLRNFSVSYLRLAGWENIARALRLFVFDWRHPLNLLGICPTSSLCRMAFAGCTGARAQMGISAPSASRSPSCLTSSHSRKLRSTSDSDMGLPKGAAHVDRVTGLFYTRIVLAAAGCGRSSLGRVDLMVRTRWLRRSMYWILLGGVALALVAGLLARAAWSSDTSGQRGSASAGAWHMQHVFVIMMENTSFKQIFNAGNRNTAYIQQLASDYGLATDYYGVSHTSLPNYLAVTSGSTWGSNSDNVQQSSVLNHTNIIDQFTQRGVSWKAYMQGLPYPGYAGATAENGLYVQKHDPFMLYPDVANNPGRAQNVVPLSELSADLATNQVPDFVWITPDVCNDMHGMSRQPCPYGSTGVGPTAQLEADGDNFIHKWVSAIMASPAWTGNSTIFITWDEGSYSNVAPYGPVDDSGCCDSPILPKSSPDPITGSGGDLYGGTVYGGGHVPMIVISRLGPRHFTDAIPGNHYSLLRTIEDNFGLPFLNCAGDSQQVHSLRAFLIPQPKR